MTSNGNDEDDDWMVQEKVAAMEGSNDWVMQMTRSSAASRQQQEKQPLQQPPPQQQERSYEQKLQAKEQKERTRLEGRQQERQQRGDIVDPNGGTNEQEDKEWIEREKIAAVDGTNDWLLQTTRASLQEDPKRMSGFVSKTGASGSQRQEEDKEKEDRKDEIEAEDGNEADADIGNSTIAKTVLLPGATSIGPDGTTQLAKGQLSDHQTSSMPLPSNTSVNEGPRLPPQPITSIQVPPYAETNVISTLANPTVKVKNSNQEDMISLATRGWSKLILLVSIIAILAVAIGIVLWVSGRRRSSSSDTIKSTSGRDNPKMKALQEELGLQLSDLYSISLPDSNITTENEDCLIVPQCMAMTWLLDDIINSIDDGDVMFDDDATDIVVSNVLDNYLQERGDINYRYALSVLYYSTNGDTWIKKDKFLSVTNECEWFNVTCNDNGEIVSLWLENNNIRGTIPSELITLSSSLEVLILKLNRLSGSLPSMIGGLTSLKELDLSRNDLTGTIQTGISALLNLNWLSLSHNILSGRIPAEIGKLNQLVVLELQVNELNDNLPTEIGLLSELTNLTIDTNFINGTIPTEVGKLEQLVTMDLDNNYLNGPLPSEIGLLTNLTYLGLSHCKIDGPLPSETISSLTKLRRLDLQNMDLSGTIPTDLLSSLTQLTRLSLSNNHLSGDLPTELGLLVGLSWIDLLTNFLSGSIPTEIGLLTNVTRISILSNDIVGPIPTQIGSLTKITFLSASQNNLSGQIPTELGRLTKLTKLYLEDNGLSGQVPTELALLTNLVEVHVTGDDIAAGVFSPLFCDASHTADIDTQRFPNLFKLRLPCEGCDCCTGCVCTGCS